MESAFSRAGNARSGACDSGVMTKPRPGSIAAALALTAATPVAAAPAHAAPAAPAPAATGVVNYAETSGPGSSDGGSLDNPIVGAGLVLLAGVGVSVALAVGAGFAGGAFELPDIPGLPF